MRTFAYRHWDSELVLVGDWAQGEAIEARLRAAHDALWSDSPPGLRNDRDPAELWALSELDHPLARALFLMYHAVGHRPAGRAGWDATIADRLRHAARKVLQEPPIAQVAAEELPRILAEDSVRPIDGAYVRWTALAVLRELAQAADAELLLTQLVPREMDSAAPDSPELTDGVDERVEAVWALAALVEREPALLLSTHLEERLLALVTDDRNVAVQIAALQALMARSPSARVCSVLRVIAETREATELAWAATVALYEHDPAVHAALLLSVHRRSTRPEGFSALFTQLELMAEDAVLRIALSRNEGPAPLIWHDPDCSIYALTLADGSAPPGADDPELAQIGEQWMNATPSARAALLVRLAGCGHAAGRALAIIAGPQEDSEYYAEEADDVAEGVMAEPLPESVATVNWVTLARLVIADPPLTRISAADGRTLVAQDATAKSEAADAKPLLSAIGQRAANHGAALTMLGKLGETSDGDILGQYLLQAPEPLLGTTLEALYEHSRRGGELPSEAPFLDMVTALARDAAGAVRQRAVRLLARFPEAVTGSLLRELTHDPTNTVCCIAERALAEQAFASPPTA